MVLEHWIERHVRLDMIDAEDCRPLLWGVIRRSVEDNAAAAEKDRLLGCCQRPPWVDLVLFTQASVVVIACGTCWTLSTGGHSDRDCPP